MANFIAETGDLERAKRMIEPHLGGQFPLFDGFARTIYARAAVEKARFADALAHVSAFDLLSREGQTYPLERAWIDLVRVLALRGLGRTEAARDALATAVKRLRTTASKLGPDDRTAFERNLAPNREILALSRT